VFEHPATNPTSKTVRRYATRILLSGQRPGSGTPGQWCPIVN
jgi:hypothetical protein